MLDDFHAVDFRELRVQTAVKLVQRKRAHLNGESSLPRLPLELKMPDAALVFPQKFVVVLIAVAVAADVNLRCDAARQGIFDSLRDDRVHNEHAGDGRGWPD